MHIVRTVQEMRRTTREIKNARQKIALVPTMGSLHAGHLSLVDEASRFADHVIVSIFVNPTQFGPGEDFEDYPRALEDDIEKICRQNDDCHVFAPSAKEMYPASEHLTWIQIEKMTKYLCGTSRPGHFRGVQTVVTKLFNICEPDYAFFGLKDAQQYFVIKKMAADLNFAVDVIGVETLRETDGVAMSSRNLNLSAAERKQATVLIAAVTEARKRIEAGERSGKNVEKQMRLILESATLGRMDYAQLVSTKNFAPVESFSSGDIVVAAVAFHFERARLIDNAIISIP